MRLELLWQFFQAHMGAKTIVIERRSATSPTAWIMLGHFIDEGTNLATHGGGCGGMAWRVPTEYEVRLIRPLQVGFFQKLVEQRIVFFRCHDQRRRFIGHELGYR